MRHHGKIGRGYIEPDAPKKETLGFRLGWSDAHDYFIEFNPPHPGRGDTEFHEQTSSEIGLTGCALKEFMKGVSWRWVIEVKQRPGNFNMDKCLTCGENYQAFGYECWDCLWILILTTDEDIHDKWETLDQHGKFSDLMVRLLKTGLVRPGPTYD